MDTTTTIDIDTTEFCNEEGHKPCKGYRFSFIIAESIIHLPGPYRYASRRALEIAREVDKRRTTEGLPPISSITLLPWRNS